jgi:RNA polymerase sigma-70 factor (ECF subfamily)
MWLVKQAQHGNAEAFVRLIEKNKTSLYKVAKSYISNDEDVADAISETVLLAYEHIHELKTAAYFKTWLTRILINQCKNIIQKEKKCVPADEITEIGYIDTSQSDIEFLDLLSRLPKEDKTIFVLYYSEGFTIRQVAEMLEMNENTVASRLSRGKQKLYTLLHEQVQ